MNNGGHGMVRFAVAKGATPCQAGPGPGARPTICRRARSKRSRPPRLGLLRHRRRHSPPCSGGQGNSYTVTVKAMDGATVLGETKLALGKY